MKILVISDTHGKLDKLRDIYGLLKDIDLVVHLGDFLADAREIAAEFGIDVISVGGNMDGVYGDEAYKILDTEYGRILLTHGHLDNVKFSLQSLLYRTQEKGCKAVLFGHTHKPAFEESDGIYLVNPGSLTLPADGTNGSYAIVNTSPESFSASIVYYQKIMDAKTAKSTKASGGYLRSLLNYSDRF